MLILFGSQAVGDKHKQSDVDLAVQAATEAVISKLHMIQELEPIFDHRPDTIITLCNFEN